MKRYRGKRFDKTPKTLAEQRAYARKYVRKLGMEMMRSEWYISENTVIVVTPGTVQSGQHRIRALAEEALKGFEELT